jgi:hypothetical protein
VTAGGDPAGLAVALEVAARDGSRGLTARVVEVGDDVVVAVSGGDRPHVGCVVLAVPGLRRDGTGVQASVSLLTIPPHKEEPIARAVAEAVCTGLGRVAVVTAGVHEDGLDRAGVDTYLRLGRELAAAVVERLGRSPG